MEILPSMDTLTKLRYYITLIFILSTLSIVFIFADIWALSGLLILIAYLLVIILMVQLYLKKTL